MIDLNADLGEGMAGDDDLLGIVTSANIACGGHIGDHDSMQRAVAGATGASVAIGAHPSYPDRDGFGRRPFTIAGAALQSALIDQIGTLAAVAEGEGTRVRYIKPHGALYHAVLRDEAHASALISAAAAHGLPLLLAPQARDRFVGVLAQQRGVALYSEGFADRGYDADGLLLARHEPGSVLTDVNEAVAQALDLAGGTVRTGAGIKVPIAVRS